MTVALLVSFYAVMALSVTFAWFKGGSAERQGAVLLVGMLVFKLLSMPLTSDRFDSLDPLALAIDLIGFAGFTGIALTARRFWPLLAAALQLLSLGAHFARGWEADVGPPAYALMKSGATALVFIVLAAGTANYRRRKRQATSRSYYRNSSCRTEERF